MLLDNNKKVSSIILSLLIIAFALVFLPGKVAIQKDLFAFLQFCIIGIIAGFNLIQETNKHAYSLIMIHWFFIFAFLFCGGLTQFAYSEFKWQLEASLGEVEFANWIIIMWELMFCLIQNGRAKFVVGNKHLKKVSPYNQVPDALIFEALILMIFIGIYPILKGGLETLYIRTLHGEYVFANSFGSQSIGLVFDSLVIGLTMWISNAAFERFRNKRDVGGAIIAVLGFLALMMNVPILGISRNRVAAVYGGILIYYFRSLLRGKRFIYLLTFGLLFIFPLLNAFRGTATQAITMDLIKNSIGSISGNFSRADYDSYSMLVYTVRYVREMGITYGRQLCGAVLFFVPRSIWSTKPIGSGATIIRDLRVTADPNVSCSLIAEGYINFGILGVLLFAATLAYILNSIDESYWKESQHGICHGATDILYSFAIPYMLFIMRGDMMSTFSFLVGFLISHYIYRKALLCTAKGKK